MRVVLFCNNWVGWQITQWLKKKDDQIVALVVHPANCATMREEIISSAALDPELVFDGSELNHKDTLGKIKALSPDMGVSALFNYILKPEYLDLFPRGVINLHPAYLPYNRGQYPNVWSIVEETQAGVTLHYMDKCIDTGDIIAQRKVATEPIDTGETLYRKLEQACVNLFTETWPSIHACNAPRQPQISDSGTCHRTKDVEKIDEIELDKKYLAKDLINIIRARTFLPYKGAYFVSEGRKVYLRLQLEYEEGVTADEQHHKH